MSRTDVKVGQIGLLLICPILLFFGVRQAVPNSSLSFWLFSLIAIFGVYFSSFLSTLAFPILKNLRKKTEVSVQSLTISIYHVIILSVLTIFFQNTAFGYLTDSSNVIFSKLYDYDSYPNNSLVTFFIGYCVSITFFSFMSSVILFLMPKGVTELKMFRKLFLFFLSIINASLVSLLCYLMWTIT